MQYVVTGATGFIGRQLLPLLLEREGEIGVLVRPGSKHRFTALRERLHPGGKRLHAVSGDITESNCGLDAAELKRWHGATVFHLAAVYDLTASAEDTERANVEGTRNAVAMANALEAACLNHVSSIAVAGRFRGRFTEEMFDEGQELDHPYFKTKFEAERIVREEASVPIRVYRPGMVIGSSETGEAERPDGPYYAFKIIQSLRDSFPSWMPFVGPEGGEMNMVPVDFVAAALDHIAHRDGLDGRTFHLVDPEPLSLGDSLNTFCRAAHAPEFALRIDRRMGKLIPGDMLSVAAGLPAVSRSKKQILDRFGIPEAALGYMDYPASFDAAGAVAALRGSGIFCPPLQRYAWKIWDFWERHLDPDLPVAANVRRALDGKVVVITGASSGIGRAVARAIAPSGATIIAVARGLDKLEEMKGEVEEAGGKVFLYPTDLSDPEACQAMITAVLAEHGHVDVLINNAGRSIRRAVTASIDRFHDFERTMKLNYFGAVALILAVLPGMRERGDGHIINVSSIGAQTFPPRFAAYVASKAALDAFAQCLAPEITAEGVAVTAIHMPLVRTPMIAPTSLYRSFPTISPDEAAEMVVKALISRPHEVSTRLGKFGQVVAAVAPGLHQLVMTAAYAALPESAPKKEGADAQGVDGEHGQGGREGQNGTDGQDGEHKEISAEAYALGMLMRGIHL